MNFPRFTVVRVDGSLTSPHLGHVVLRPRATRIRRLVHPESSLYRSPRSVSKSSRLRASFGQRLKDAGAPIEAVSKALRHTTVATTEKFYARIRSNRAWDALERAWETPRVDVVH